MTEPAIKLLGYQLRWVRDKSRRRVCVKSRAIGMTWLTGLEAACDAAGVDLGFDGGPVRYEPARGTSTILIATTERRASAHLEVVAQHLQALAEVVGEPLIDKRSESRIRLRNGAEVMALPGGSASALHGWRGHVVIDEASRIADMDEIWRAVLPIASATISRRDGYKISVVSTPAGQGNHFHRLVEGDLRAWGSVHRVPIEVAHSDGFPLSPEQALADAGGDRALFEQQYRCSFTTGEGRLLAPELLQECLVDRSDMPTPPRERASWLVGYDPARTKDRAAVVEAFVYGDQVWVHAVEERQGEGWREQRAWLDEVLTRRWGCAVDVTGLGSMIGEELRRDHGGRVQPMHFGSAEVRERVFGGLSQWVNRGCVRIPKDLHSLIGDLGSIRREVSPAGLTKYVVPRREGGHGDAGVALGLALTLAPMPWLGHGKLYQSIQKRPVDWSNPRGWDLGSRDGESGEASLQRRYGRGRPGGWGRHY